MRAGTLNETKYGELLSTALPRIIHNEEELERFTGILLDLDRSAQQTPEQIELAELLAALIENYESLHYPLRRATPVETISFLMEQRGLSGKDLVPVVGSKGTVSDVINGKRSIGIATAVKLGEFFRVPPELFIEWKAYSASMGD